MPPRMVSFPSFKETAIVFKNGYKVTMTRHIIKIVLKVPNTTGSIPIILIRFLLLLFGDF